MDILYTFFDYLPSRYSNASEQKSPVSDFRKQNAFNEEKMSNIDSTKMW